MKTIQITTEELIKALFESKIEVGVIKETHFFGKNDEEYLCEGIEMVSLVSKNRTSGIVADDVYLYGGGDMQTDGFGFVENRTFAVIELTLDQNTLVKTFLEAKFNEIANDVSELIATRQYEVSKGYDIENDTDNITSIYKSI